MMVFMEAAIPYSQISSSGVGYDVYHAVLVITSVILGWRATGVLFRNLTEKKDGKEDSALHSAEAWLHLLAPWCIGSTDSLVTLFDKEEHGAAPSAEEHMDDLAFTSPGMSLLEHYGVFGASGGAWSSNCNAY
eukprot:gnl/MRDRNA2_/MRDRNA2_89841_c0_seq1.p1 gnl/MRDRNA2_/MRDRNA2_89841_c0~~gnl/MRDRNA2_/MRDRNA2_89841_c0_seq1.p1  ORF type:complete len:133 (-),score=22.62 gnl/MRDRNA2_/MRDRNA2_89841_c0_seq1:44-442(-)